MRKQIILISTLIVIAVIAGESYDRRVVLVNDQQSVSSENREVSQIAGEIEGFVINVEGQRVAGARVFAERDDALNSLVMSSYTDDSGAFKINLREAGFYRLYGSKEDDGYPLTISGFHQVTTIPSPKVSVAEHQVIRDVIVQFGPKVSKINGSIVDSTTGHFISKATIILRRVDDSQMSYVIGAGEAKENGRFNVLVPPVPFTIEVSAPDYETWNYTKDSANHHIDSLQVQSGQTKTLKITMHPTKRQL